MKKFSFIDIHSFNEDTDMLTVGIPFMGGAGGEPLNPVDYHNGCVNDDLDADDCMISIHLFSALLEHMYDGPELVGKRFKLSISPSVTNGGAK